MTMTMPAICAARRIHALTQTGHTLQWIAAQTGLHIHTLRAIADHQRDRVYTNTYRRIAHLHDTAVGADDQHQHTPAGVTDQQLAVLRGYHREYERLRASGLPITAHIREQDARYRGHMRAARRAKQQAVAA